MISIQDLTYTYPGSTTAALERVDLGIQAGELAVVSGGSGGGKSTLLRSMNGLIPHFHGGRISGQVIVDGLSTLTRKPRDLASAVGFVGQDPEDHGVVDRVEDDIAFTLENLGTDPATMRKRIEEILDALSIADLRGRRLSELSGGERQRVAIAGAMAAMPGHLVLDEPTSQLDPQSAEEVINALLRLRDEHGVSIVMAEHRLDRVLQYADRLVVVNKGRCTSGEPRDVIADYGFGPPVVELGKLMGWRPLPLSVREAWRFTAGVSPRLPDPPPRSIAGDIAVQVNDVGVSFRDRQVLRNIKLSARQGEVLALMGRNGSGKTTLIRTIAGLQPCRGSVTKPRSVALVPQNPQVLLFRQTLRDEIAATLKGRGVRRPDVEQEALWFGVSHLLDRYPREISGGERTLAAIAASTAGEPDLILLDEPTRGLDPGCKKHLRGLIHRWRAAGRSVILATHDVEFSALVADRVVILSEAEIIVDAPPEEALSSSLTFSTQMNKVLKTPNILTVGDAVQALETKTVLR